jgi:alpha-tubulin suppressor-like RCC1 family protein
MAGSTGATTTGAGGATTTGAGGSTGTGGSLPIGGLPIAAGGNHTCAVTSTGAVKCWGDNSYGQLGDGTMNGSRTPVDVKGLMSGVVAVAAGLDHSCALTNAGVLKCWGHNDMGQLGNGTTTDSNAPVDLKNLPGSIAAVTAGYRDTCAVNTAGDLLCWGDGTYDQLGTGVSVVGPNPAPNGVLYLGSGAAAASTGAGHTCALTSAGGLKCWGNNLDGQLGAMYDMTESAVPLDVVHFMMGAAGIAAGGNHTCGLMASGGVKCWGDDASGQLGDMGALMGALASNVPVDVYMLGAGVLQISAGAAHTCAILSSGGLKCWGDNSYGQIGSNAGPTSNAPVDVPGLLQGVSVVSAGGDHTCVTSGGVVMCWGSNGAGELGDNTMMDRNQPVPVQGL